MKKKLRKILRNARKAERRRLHPRALIIWREPSKGDGDWDDWFLMAAQNFLDHRVPDPYYVAVRTSHSNDTEQIVTHRGGVPGEIFELVTAAYWNGFVHAEDMTR